MEPKEEKGKKLPQFSHIHNFQNAILIDVIIVLEERQRQRDRQRDRQTDRQIDIEGGAGAGSVEICSDST